MFLRTKFHLLPVLILINILLLLPFTALGFDFQKDSGLEATAQKTGHQEMEVFNSGGLPGAIGFIIGIILSFTGVIFLLLTIYSGFLWMTAAGNQEQINKAKKIITAAVIGIIIVGAAYAITAFIGNYLA
jgi:hypothetical protein